MSRGIWQVLREASRLEGDGETSLRAGARTERCFAVVMLVYAGAAIHANRTTPIDYLIHDQARPRASA
ncbi:MAG TPA: hypothetical protein VMV92_16535 [Streptosporangiaceae bacterium]|nr:hypothetical protein [Streptosporangiaceae bacterium]